MPVSTCQGLPPASMEIAAPNRVEVDFRPSNCRAARYRMQVFLDSSVGAWLQNVALRLSPVDVLCILGAMVIMHVCRYAGMWVYALTALPGTVAHELAHFSVAFVLGARPAFPSLVPVRTQQSWRLGSVAFRVGHARALPIAMAPLLLAPLALWWAAALLHPAVPPLYFLHVWIVAALLSASLPSRADFRLALPALGVLALLAMIAAIAWFALGKG